MKPYLPGLDHGEVTHVTRLNTPPTPRTYTAKWWMRPICWLTRRPTTITR